MHLLRNTINSVSFRSHYDYSPLISESFKPKMDKVTKKADEKESRGKTGLSDLC